MDQNKPKPKIQFMRTGQINSQFPNNSIHTSSVVHSVSNYSPQQYNYTYNLPVQLNSQKKFDQPTNNHRNDNMIINHNKEILANYNLPQKNQHYQPSFEHKSIDPVNLFSKKNQFHDATSTVYTQQPNYYKKQNHQTTIQYHTNNNIISNGSPLVNQKHPVTNYLHTTNCVFSQQQIEKLLGFLQTGSLSQFLEVFKKILKSQSKEDQRVTKLREFYQNQSKFYQDIKEKITGSADSRILYGQQTFYFFEQIPQLLNKIAEILLNKLCTQRKKDHSKMNYQNTLKKYKQLAIAAQDMSRNMISFSVKVKQVDKIKKQLEDQKNKNYQLTTSLNELNKRIQDLQTNNQKKTNSISKFNDQTLLKQLKNKITKLQDSNRNLLSTICQLQKDKQQYKNNLQSTISQVSQNQQIKSQIQYEKSISLQNQLKRLNADNSKLIQDLNRQKQIKNIRQSQIYQLKLKLRDYQNNQKNEVQIKDKNYQQPFKFILQSSSLIQYSNFIFKQRLFNIIKDYMHSNPIQFSLLYKYNPYFQSNFHNYIDNKENLLLMVRLANDVVIGGFSAQPLRKSFISKNGFLFSLTKNKRYPLKSNSNCLIYDQCHLSFGNSQIRIRNSSNSLYSNFAMSTGSFDHGYDTISDFLYGSYQKNQNQSKQRDIVMKGYEIYQVNFSK